MRARDCAQIQCLNNSNDFEFQRRTIEFIMIGFNNLYEILLIQFSINVAKSSLFLVEFQNLKSE